MTDVIKMSQKAFTASVVALTIAWSVGLSALLAPLASSAATSGSLIKASLPAVYYMGSDGKRYVFPNEATYKTWYSDFSGVMTITDSELASLPIGGNVTMKPGAKMVKITTDPKVYAVDAHGVLRWVKTEAAAVALYGSNWNHMILDIPDAFFTNYTVGADIASSSDFNPASAGTMASSINADKGLGASVSSSLSVMLSAGQSAGGTLPSGANGVNVLKVDVRNGGSSAATVDTITVHRSGSGVAGDIANAYVYAGNDRLTTGRTFNSTSHDATFSGLNLALAAGETKTVWIGVDFKTIAGGALASDQHSFSISDLRVGSAVASGLPVSGPSFTLSGATVGGVTVSKSGTITNPKAGQMGAKVAEFQLAAGSTEDINLSKIALFYGGSVSREKVSNFVLKQNGLTIATVAAISSKDLVSFVLANSMLIEKGNTRTFEVYADIAGTARSSENIKFYVDQTTDILAIGATYGYGVATTIGTTYDGSTCAASGDDCSFSNVDAGQLTITFNGPSAHDVATNGKDVELFNFTMAAQANLEVRETKIEIVRTAGTLAANDMTDVKITDTATGATVAGPQDINNTTGTQDLTFTETYNFTAGQSRTFKVTADIASTAAMTAIKASLQPFGTNKIRNLDSSTYLGSSDIVPNSKIAGNTNNVKSPSLTVGLSSTPIAQTYIKGTQGAPLAAFTLKAGDAGDIKVNTLALQGRVDTNDGTSTCTVAPNGTFTAGQENASCSSFADIVQTLKLWNGSTQLSATKSPTSGTGGVVTFDNLNLTVPAGQTLTLTVTGNLSNALLTANLPDDVDLQVTAAGSVSATDKDGNSVTATLSATPVDGPNMRVADAGSITVALAPDDSESEASLVIGGSSNTVLGKYKLTAQNEELKLTKTRINLVTGANSTAITSVSLYDGATLVGGPVAMDGSGVADFSGMNFVIPKDGSKVLTVKANLNSVGASGATSGLDLKVQMSASGSAFEVRGTSAGSSTQLTTFTGTPISANSKVIRKTKPSVSLVALPSTTLQAGQVAVMRFTVSADSAGDVALKGIVTQIQNATAASTITVISGSDSSIRRVGDATDVPGASALVASCTTGVTCVLVSQFTTEEVIAAGTSRTYDVRVANSAAAANDSVSSKLLGDTTLASGVLTAGTPATKLTVGGSANQNFVWSDNSVVPHVATVGSSSADWANSTYVKVLPTDVQTMSK